MKHMGDYEILSHVEMPDCSLRIIGMKEAEHVALHYHEKCAQIYTVLEQEVEGVDQKKLEKFRPAMVEERAGRLVLR